MKNKAVELKKKIESLPKSEQASVWSYYQKRPERIFGVQKSLLKGFSDLPIFQGSSEEQQQDLF
jgi:hypothetical protein